MSAGRGKADIGSVPTGSLGVSRVSGSGMIWNLSTVSEFTGIRSTPFEKEDPMNRLNLLLGTLMALSICTASAKDKPSEAFLKKAIEGNYAEVSMGDLAQKNGQSDGVKSFGKMLSTDHAAANQKATDAAKSIGMNPPTGPNAKQKAEYDRMSKTSGTEFDKIFATHMIADHRKDIAEYKKASKMKDAAGDYASGEIDTLQKHLDTAKSLKSRK